MWNGKFVQWWISEFVKLCYEHLTLPAAAKADFMAAAISIGLAPASAIDLERNGIFYHNCSDQLWERIVLVIEKNCEKEKDEII